MTALPTGTVTLLFTDIEGSTRLLQELGDAYAGVLARHRLALRQTFTARGGVEVDTQGDSLFYAFASAAAAVAAAAEAQRALANGEARVRIGIHTGEPTVTEEGYVGIAVHRAARVMAAGHGGQVLLSEAVRSLVDDELPLRDLGEHRLKDLTQPVRLYQLGGEEFPPLRTLERHPTNLPAQPTPLVGRERELAEAEALLREDGARLLTLTGPGGAGKTRLALQLGAEMLEDFADGVFFCPLALVTDPELLLRAVAQALNLRESPGQSPEEALGAYLGSRELLLVLDNLEQVLVGVPALAGLLASAPGVSLLATSRAPLRLAGEREYPVSSLAESEAIELFGERAKAVRPDLDFSRCRDAVVQICRRLDSLPLAIELAAARVRMLSPEKLLDRLEQRLPILTGGARDAPERQRTLRAAIDWSHDLLSPEERELFRRLPVFAGGFTLEAAEEVAQAELDVLSSLVENSLLRQEERFAMLETIREYAAEQLTASGEAEAFRLRHAEHYVRLAEQADAGLRGREQQLWFGRLTTELENLRAALRVVQALDDPELEVRLAGALGTFWYWQSLFQEADDAFEHALARVRPAPSPARAKLLYVAGIAAGWRGDWSRGRVLSEEARSLFERFGDSRFVIECLWTLTIVAAEEGRSHEEVALADDAVRLSREAGDLSALATSLGNVSDRALRRGDFQSAWELGEESASLCRETGEVNGYLRSRFNAGCAAAELGRTDEAASRLREVASGARDAGQAEGVVVCLCALASLAAAAGDVRRAARLVGASEALEADAGFHLVGYERELRDRTRQAAEQTLGNAVVREAIDEGRALGLEEAIEYALEELE